MIFFKLFVKIPTSHVPYIPLRDSLVYKLKTPPGGGISALYAPLHIDNVTGYFKY